MNLRIDFYSRKLSRIAQWAVKLSFEDGLEIDGLG